MAITSLGLLATGSATTAGTTLAVVNTTGAAIPAGTLIHITGVWDNTATVTAPTITCSTVGGGTAIANHAAAVGSGVTTTAGAGIWHQCFRVLTTASIASGATVATLTSDQSAIKRQASAHGFTLALTTLRGTVTTGTSTTGSPTVTSTGTALVAGDLVIGSVSFENSAAMTGDTDTLNGSWSALTGPTPTTGGAANTNVGCAAQSKIVTATGAQTFNPTGGVADTIACVYSLQPTPDPTVTQASYRFYADGTETGATALAAQDTAYTADVTAGDANLLLRTRLQSTNATALPVTDDWRLQWEKNASGTWLNVAESIVDSFTGPSNANFGIDVLDFISAGQSFLGTGQTLAAAKFALKKDGSPTFDITAKLYAHTGTYGVMGSVPTGSALATSTTVFNAASLSTTTETWVTFAFDNTFLLAAGTPYFIVVTLTAGGGDFTNSVLVMASTTGAHSGLLAQQDPGGTWSGSGPSFDALFEVDTTASAVVPYASANLTDGAATTNRLGAGTGSFTAGEVSETGLVTDLGWSGNNYTELLYALTLVKAALANSDTLRFRVVRNGATTGLTYTAVPTIPVTIGAGGATQSAAGSLAGTAATTATSTVVHEASASLTVTASRTAASDATHEALAARTATAALVAAATATVGGVTQEASATLAVTASPAATSAAVRDVSGTLAATASRAAAVSVAREASSTLPVTAAQSSAPAVAREAGGALGVTASRAAASTAAHEALAALALTEAAAATSTVTEAVWAIQGTLPVAASGAAVGSVVHEATGALAVTASGTAAGVVAEAAWDIAGTLSATASAAAAATVTHEATAALAPTASLAALVVRTQESAAALAGTATRQASATVVHEVSATLAVAAATTASPAGGGAAVPIQGTLAVTASGAAVGSVVHEASASLAVTANRATAASATHEATGTRASVAAFAATVSAVHEATGTRTTTATFVAAGVVAEAAWDIAGTLSVTATRTAAGTVVHQASAALVVTSTRAAVATSTVLVIGKGTVVVGGVRKTVVNRWVIVGGAKRPVVNAWVIQSGAKKATV